MTPTNDRQELEELRRRLVAQAERLTRDPDRAQDLAQDALLKVLLCNREASNTASKPRDIKPWARRVLFRDFVSAWRKEQVRQHHHTANARPVAIHALGDFSRSTTSGRGPSIEDTLDRKRNVEALNLAMHRLPESMRTTFELVALQGFSFQECATAMRCPTGTVMSRLHRARSRIRADMPIEA